MQEMHGNWVSRTRWRPLELIRLCLLSLVVAGALVMATPVQAQQKTHVVRYGESLAQIARQYNVNLRELMSTNGIGNPNLIYAGQKLLIPASVAAVYGTPANQQLPGSSGYYVVQRGDTLSQIAQRYGMTITDLMRLNGINNPSFVWVGQRLRVTARVAAINPQRSPQPQLADNIYVVQPGDSLSVIAKRFNTSTQALMAANGLPNGNFVWVGQRLRISGAGVPENTLAVAGAPANGRRWIEIDLSAQTLTAWQGDMKVLHTTISSGRPNTPTVTGRFKINRKYASQRMTGPGYDLPGVPWVMYFYGAYAIHGAYWHTNFGQVQSHGCVNMRVHEAEVLYNWAANGTEVYVHY